MFLINRINLNKHDYQLKKCIALLFLVFFLKRRANINIFTIQYVAASIKLFALEWFEVFI